LAWSPPTLDFICPWLCRNATDKERTEWRRIESLDETSRKMSHPPRVTSAITRRSI
jgi:hypothetical protein